MCYGTGKVLKVDVLWDRKVLKVDVLWDRKSIESRCVMGPEKY